MRRNIDLRGFAAARQSGPMAGGSAVTQSVPSLIHLFSLPLRLFPTAFKPCGSITSCTSPLSTEIAPRQEARLECDFEWRRGGRENYAEGARRPRPTLSQTVTTVWQTPDFVPP
jgi:hypothetical protein